MDISRDDFFLGFIIGAIVAIILIFITLDTFERTYINGVHDALSGQYSIVAEEYIINTETGDYVIRLDPD